MEDTGYDIKINYLNNDINNLLSDIKMPTASYTKHFNHSEEFFLTLGSEFIVPRLPIHHDVRLNIPETIYLEGITEVLTQLIKLAPDIFNELTYFFDPTDILKANFFHLCHIDDMQYVYLLKVDLSSRCQDYNILDKGNNDMTPRYRTNHLYVDGIFIPLEDINFTHGKIHSFKIKQMLSETWIGERGRGYFAKGIWIDDDLTKFFSKLFLPKGKKYYPYYPFVCRYKTICQALITLSSQDRKLYLPLLHRALKFLSPFIDKIQHELKNNSFSEDSTIFKTLQNKVSPIWNSSFKDLKIEYYLNKNDMKEFKVDI